MFFEQIGKQMIDFRIYFMVKFTIRVLMKRESRHENKT